MKLAGTSATIMYNIIESGHNWWAPGIRVKGQIGKIFFILKNLIDNIIDSARAFWLK